MTPTSQHTIGPFFPRTFFQPGDNDLTRLAADAAPSTRGEAILLRGRVLRAGGVPCVNAVLEAWQADASGHFRHPLDPGAAEADPDFCGWGRAWTDAEGGYEFRTLSPGGYGDRAPHINLHLMGAGLMRMLRTTVFFPGVGADPVLDLVPPERRSHLIARPEGAGLFRFDLLLRGDAADETPFFED
ncbi:protocatechuate 3,4-dioxygenase alpha subunit/protocatechuate 3,4-dioxygenase beta subunit [Humitalea rosea]|uniref:Protocatechuate 3,4-dioxygenase alpha subunit/protocatechuate 3,4-dioxygenase beta subunit n=1 Tax=Humitalea rosea TaxID=990373 RepID=A0A2W7IGR1_9PROT|nr:protocatechuate 3,4-dioxygenase subunit alpha [Humitalea rosea]PZW45951.1 protocatechuate 3,4-dioxygenase alpha subunit/protocatechuate 3,4-dioxygenase beta subunit [Humitalea rosea]